jgi:DNA-binding LacI/PurR family transcriptional regulator
MGYNQDDNREARVLANKRYGQRVKNGIVAVMFWLPQGVSVQGMPFFDPILEGMRSEAAGLGLEICLCPSPSGELPRLVRDRNVDGVIAIGYFANDIVAIQKLGMPVVTFQSSCDIGHSVTSDDREGGRQATRHLLELGHRRIAFLGADYHSGLPAELRLQGYQDAMQEYGIEVPPEWICMELASPYSNADCTYEESAAGIGWEVLLAQNGATPHDTEMPFTGLVCYNDMIAMGAIGQIRSMGFAVPQQISVTSFDDISVHYQFEPALTSIDFQREKMGREAIRLLGQVIDENRVGESEDALHSVIPTTLVVRQSTCPLPTDDGDMSETENRNRLQDIGMPAKS